MEERKDGHYVCLSLYAGSTLSAPSHDNTTLLIHFKTLVVMKVRDIFSALPSLDDSLARSGTNVCGSFISNSDSIGVLASFLKREIAANPDLLQGYFPLQLLGFSLAQQLAVRSQVKPELNLLFLGGFCTQDIVGSLIYSMPYTSFVWAPVEGSPSHEEVASEIVRLQKYYPLGEISDNITLFTSVEKLVQSLVRARLQIGAALISSRHLMLDVHGLDDLLGSRCSIVRMSGFKMPDSMKLQYRDEAILPATGLSPHGISSVFACIDEKLAS